MRPKPWYIVIAHRMQARPSEQCVSFEDYTFDLRSAILFKHGRWIRVPDQSLKVLAALLENPGAIITREELSRRLWPNGTHVEFEQGLNSVIKRLRAVLLDSPTAPRFIETLPKRGYRFICPVEQALLAPGNSEPLARDTIAQQPAASISRASGLHLALELNASRRIAVLLAVLLISASAAILYQRASGRSRALAEAIPRARSLATQGEYGSAYDLAAAAAARLPTDDPQLERLWAIVSRNITITSRPSDAAVFWQPYADLKSPWRYLGKTPLSDGRVSAAAVRLRLSKPGYADLEIAAPEPKYQLRMETTGTQPGMVHIPAGPLFAQYVGIGRLGPLTLNDFWMDRTEVTNSEYQSFVNAGGYQNPQYWKSRVIENGSTLSWNEAMARFTDQTGSRSPAGWSAGAYPVGEGDYPVSGVSWYEAAAYANFEGKALPTVYQWFRAAATEDSAYIIALSNFNGHRPVPVKSQGTLGQFGVYDMAGNVREWCLNESGGMRFILGGAWSDPTYMFTRGQKLPPLNRSPTNGFRCVRSVEPVEAQPQLATPIPPAVSNRMSLTPASDGVFETYRSLYAYDHTDLHPTVESVTDSEVWRREKVRFRAGYPNQEVIAYVFLPKERRPPYQCVVFVPSGDAFQARSGDTIQPLDYVLRSGRAMMYPILWGTFDRFVHMPSDPANAGYPSPMFIREALIAWRKDLGRTLDYLQTRTDIGSIGYLGLSTGAEFAPVLLARDKRVKAAVLLSGAMPAQMKLMPESNPLNFAPRLTIPVLMLNGRYDSILTPDAQDWMFRSLGTAAPNKAHILVDSGHSVLAPEVRNKTIHETLGWFDRYLSSR
jgi:formylglycine-generating enzyme required for sulfatase activity/DNA-binding winged helix-turn-helix (wHTH) protein/dienelactone hydrolase